MKKGVKIILIISILVVFILAIYFTLFFSYTCKENDLACFKVHQEKCVRTNFIKNSNDAVWSYKILGKNNGMCNVKASILSVKEGTPEKKKLEGQSMICSLEKGSTLPPEHDLMKCHGELREGLQEMIIQNLHKYIIDNLGSIKEELYKTI